MWIRGQQDIGLLSWKKPAKKTKDELRARGIAPNEPSELDQALEELLERDKSAE